MTASLRQAPHDNITYLSALALLLGEELDHVCSAVETQYTCSAFTQPGWFEAERAAKGALLQAELAATTAAAAAVPVYVAGVDPATLRLGPPVPLDQLLETIAGAFDVLLEQYEHGQRPLKDAKALIAALARCAVACRMVEPRGSRYGQPQRREPVGLSGSLTMMQVHLMLLVGQYELSLV